MSFIGTFGMFTTARLGIYTSQQGLNLTGNNIANINTTGYTRQVLDIKSMNASGQDRYSDSNVRVGSGAYADSISQLRDPYLDIRYRTECASVGFMDTKLSNLDDVAAILDEIGDGEDENGILSAQLNDFLQSLEKLSEYTGQMEFDTQARSSAMSLVTTFNSYADRLEQVGKNAVDQLKQDIDKVNHILTNIRDLNASIRKCEIHGSPALEMQDERNRLIDELSQYIKIDVKSDMEEIAAGVRIEKLSISISDTYNPSINLVDGIYATQLELDNSKNNYDIKLTSLKDIQDRVQPHYQDLIKEKNLNPNNLDATLNRTYGLTAKIKEMTANNATRLSWSVGSEESGLVQMCQLTKNTDNTYNLTVAPIKYSTDMLLGDNVLYGSLQASREFLTESGEFASQTYVNTVDKMARTKYGLPYYQKSLDLLAKKFADTMNAANSGYCYDKDGNYVNAQGKPIKKNGIAVNKNTFKTDFNWSERDLANFLKKNGGVQPEGAGALFSTRSDNNETEGITASKLAISADWASGNVKIVNSYAVIPGGTQIASTDNTNILHMIYQMNNENISYSPNEISTGAGTDSMFTGNFSNMFVNITSVLGNDQRSTKIMLDNYYASAVELDTGRDSVSSVDLNDETVNMIQYQKSYSAACRLMTAMDEVLDKLINGTGVAGR
ncbi:MAG: hypothetical protein IJ955_04250 [Oscillospiraceae bacterium]|nr:hypothetical protein [Oscillospiraceae bacterium]